MTAARTAVSLQIGIVGGMGPAAGFDFARRIVEFSGASSDQQHFDVTVVSAPGLIPDRTDFLLGRTSENPAFGIVCCLERLAASGAQICALACNTSHAPAIIDVVYEQLERRGLGIELLHMVDLLARRLASQTSRVGVMTTEGAWRARVYHDAFDRHGIQVLDGGSAVRATVHQAIYDPQWGLKARSSPVHPSASERLHRALGKLADLSVGTVVLGCTELPLALPESHLFGVELVNPAALLAEELVLRATHRPQVQSIASEL